jgi:hypothetical protein
MIILNNAWCGRYILCWKDHPLKYTDPNILSNLLVKILLLMFLVLQQNKASLT